MVNPFFDILGATATTSVLTDFMSIDETISMPIEDLVDYLNGKSKGKFTDSDEVAKLLEKLCQSIIST